MFPAIKIKYWDRTFQCVILNAPLKKKVIVYLNSTHSLALIYNGMCLEVHVICTCQMNSLRPVWLQWMSNELIIMGLLSVTITFTVCYCFYT